MKQKRVLLITGGTRSGKSRYALERALAWEERVFLATAVPFDEEMRRRIAGHQAERADTFATVEEPYDIASALRSLPPETEVVLLDCLTVWLGNLMHRHGAEKESYPEMESFIDYLREPSCNLVLVTNEVGMGIVPENAMARHYRDIAGALNRRVAELADEVVMTVCGLPLTLKKPDGSGTGVAPPPPHQCA